MMSIDSPEFRDLRATAVYERTLDELNELKEKYIELKEINKELKKTISQIWGKIIPHNSFFKHSISYPIP